MFVKNNEVNSTPCGEGVSRKILGYSENIMMVEVTFEKGAVGDVHSHLHEQVSYIVSGSFEFQLDDDKQIVRQGDSIYIKSNMPHGVRALEENSVIVDVFTPMRSDFL